MFTEKFSMFLELLYFYIEYKQIFQTVFCLYTTQWTMTISLWTAIHSSTCVNVIALAKCKGGCFVYVGVWVFIACIYVYKHEHNSIPLTNTDQ